MEMHSIPLREHVVAKLMRKRAASIHLTKYKQESMERDNAWMSSGGESLTWSQIRAHAEDCDGKHSSGESLALGVSALSSISATTSVAAAACNGMSSRSKPSIIRYRTLPCGGRSLLPSLASLARL
jgi:hypothetical protein